MQKDQIDQGLNFKKRARRRLVGAIALVLLMVIVLPKILKDREERVSTEEIEIVMPNQDASDLVASVDSSQAVEIQAPVINEVIVLPEAKTPTVAPEPKPKKVTEPKKVAEPKKKKLSKPAEEKKVTEKKPVPATTSNKFYVQIGVFSNLGNVKKLQVKLDDLGYQSVTEKLTTDNGLKTRLRTEVFIGRNEAAIALENIKDAGLTGMVVNQK